MEITVPATKTAGDRHDHIAFAAPAQRHLHAQTQRVNPRSHGACARDHTDGCVRGANIPGLRLGVACRNGLVSVIAIASTIGRLSTDLSQAELAAGLQRPPAPKPNPPTNLTQAQRAFLVRVTVSVPECCRPELTPVY